MPRTLFVVGGEAWPTNNNGEPLDPLGTINAKTLLRLGRELNKHGYPIEQPESKNRLAKSYGVSRSTVDKLLQADTPKNLVPDGKGGVAYEVTSDEIIDSIETVQNIRRGRRQSKN